LLHLHIGCWSTLLVPKRTDVLMNSGVDNYQRLESRPTLLHRVVSVLRCRSCCCFI
jgi:hypothetical protein